MSLALASSLVFSTPPLITSTNHSIDILLNVQSVIKYYTKNFDKIIIGIGKEQLSSICMPEIIRGGVEDTRLEAKAKDTQKIRGQGQGQPFRGQTPSRPRTGMFEAKTKDQGHKHKCSPKTKKRSSQKFFRQSPQNNVFQKLFHTLHKILTIQKIVLSSSRGQANFRGLEASRPRPRT